MCVNREVCQCCAKYIDDEAWSGLALPKVSRAVVSDDLDQFMTHLQLDCPSLARILLHTEGYKVEHRLVFEDRGCVEDSLVVECG